jgi:predicted dienelactone hydrolase
MFGFSLGGFTTLVEIGGIPDLNRTRELCTKHPAAPECLFIKQRNGDQLSPQMVTAAWTHDNRVKAVVLAAPAVSYLFGPGSLKDVTVPVQLWRASNDDQVPDAWNTAVIRQELPKTPEEHVVTRAGHYAFLPPCSEGLAKQVPQICTDDPSFDRPAFHRAFNRAVVGFFQRALVPYR